MVNNLLSKLVNDPAPFGEDLRWRAIWFVHFLQHSVAEASLFLGTFERTVEHYIFKFSCDWQCKVGQYAAHMRKMRDVFQLKKDEFLLSLESRTLRQMFIVGVFIFLEGEHNL